MLFYVQGSPSLKKNNRINMSPLESRIPKTLTNTPKPRAQRSSEEGGGVIYNVGAYPLEGVGPARGEKAGRGGLEKHSLSASNGLRSFSPNPNSRYVYNNACFCVRKVQSALDQQVNTCAPGRSKQSISQERAQQQDWCRRSPLV